MCGQDYIFYQIIYLPKYVHLLGQKKTDVTFQLRLKTFDPVKVTFFSQELAVAKYKIKHHVDLTH